MAPTKRRITVMVAAFAMFATMGSAPALAGGVLTPDEPFITLDPSLPGGSAVMAIISSGETVDGVLFEGLPDGIGVKPGATRDTVDVYIAHEQTTVPFFGTADFQDASVTKLTLSTAPTMRGAVLASEIALSSDDGYLRFCSASMAGPAEGFPDYAFFTGEEANNVVDVADGSPISADRAIAPQRQAGLAVVLDTASGDSTAIPGLGRLNHENTIALPDRGNIVLLTTDDTFSGPSAQLYMYTARDAHGVFADEGVLWAFRVTGTEGGGVDATDPFNGANDYLDLQPGDNWSGEFIRVPDSIADGATSDLAQTALEDWSNENNVFQFIRLEDLAYDKNDPNVIYIADTGRTRVIPDDSTGRMVRGPSGTVGEADNGRIFKMVLDPRDARSVVGFSVLADGDADPGSDVYVPFVNPDNLDTSKRSLMVQEDTDGARIWHQSLPTGIWSVVATVNDPDGESTGIVDVSEWFGPGTWLLNVQGHGVNVDESQDGDVLHKRESGQLMLLRIPGS